MGIRIPQSNVPLSVAVEAITKEMHDGLRRATTTTASSLEAKQGSGNLSKTQTKATTSGLISLRTSSEGGPSPTITRLHTGPEELQTLPVPQDEDEHEPMFIQPHDPDFMQKPIYPKYIPLEDEHILPAKEQPLPPVVSPTAESPGYVAELDPEEDLEEYEVDETEDGPVDYHMDGGNDEDDDDDDSSGDDTDDEDEDEEEEEHLALADFAVVIP
nr:hypothetical protein [Tanacetum cinerariifolium]